MGNRHLHLRAFTRSSLCIVVALASGCGLFKKKEDEGTPPIALSAPTAVVQPPVFNVNAAASAAAGGTTATTEPAHRHTLSRAGAPAASPAAAASVAASPVAAASAAPATPAPATAAAAPALPVVSPACLSTCTASFATCLQGGQMPACQQALKTCTNTCNGVP